MQLVVVIPYRHFGTFCRYIFQGSIIKNLILADVTNKLSRNVCKELPLLVA